jgi:hypothetical protein
MSDAIRRGLRTALWGILAMAGAIPGLAAAFDIPAGRVAQITGGFTASIAVLTAIINALEDGGVIPALLKAPASSGEHPMPDDAG